MDYFGAGHGGGMWELIPLVFNFLKSVFFHKERATSEILELESNSSRNLRRLLRMQDQWSGPAPSRLGYEYEVFLSFRGPDTRRGFADCLCTRLRDAGIHVFRDNENLHSGEEIGPKLRQGIAQSKVSIPIFSKGYASSKWCLQELDFIAKCRKERTQIVMPIFYDVTPDQVKYQTGTYEEALQQHASKRPQYVQHWRRSLSEIGQLKGWVLEDIADGHQGQLIKLVVASVIRELKKARLPLNKMFVGIDKHADEVMSLLDVGFGVGVIGIYGISGIGKTTLAKHVYNKLLNDSEFEGCSSLDNIREKCLQPNGLEWLQSKLVSDVTRCERRYFDSVDEGTAVLMHSFREKKVLILLDDVGHIDQLNALVAEPDWFGPGSRIIVTTTDGCILREAPQVNSSYEFETMDHDEALELFNHHAFRTDPSADPSTAKRIPLAEQIVTATGRIPLALEVIGRYLCDRSKEEWEAMLQKLRVTADKKILAKLRISYDDLDDEYKQIFLDVACFFIGVDSRLAVHMWRDCVYFPDVGIQVLLHRCLIKIGEDNKLWMHDSLRDLGRAIVRQENKAPEMRSRLWCSEEARDVLQKNKGTGNIEAMSLRSESGVYYLFHGQFESMSNLRFLQLECADIVGDFQPVSTLRWLSLQKSSFEFATNILRWQKLLILDMSRSELTNDWRGWSSLKKAVKLKVLDLTGCHRLTKTPDLSMFPNLEKLILEDCKRLEEVQELMVALPHLSSLNLKNCSSIRKLPVRLGFLKYLVELIIDGTSIIGLPDSLGSLKKLRRLSANDCRDLKELPSSMGRLSLLVQLSLSHTGIKALPDSVGNLKNMEVLDISSSNISHFPRALEKLEKLKVINASKCENLKGDIPTELGKLCSLEVLKLDGTNIKSIPETITGLSHLQTLHLTGCSSLESLPELPVSLASLRVTSQLVEGIPNLPRLINLEELVLSTGTLQCEMGSLLRLKVLSFPSCTKLQSLLKLPISLQKLNISNSSIRTMPEFSNLHNLSELSLEKCFKLTEIPSLRYLIILKSLKVRFCPMIKRLGGLEGLESLRMLQVSFCGNLTTLPDLTKLKKLSVINASGCERLIGFRGLDSLYSLTNLDIGNCKSIESLPDLSNLTLLRSLNADGCEKLKGLKGVGELEELLSLQISGCREIKRLPDLSKLKNLRHLNIAGCEGISDVYGLSELKSLQLIVISRHNLAKLRDLPEEGDSVSPGCNNASMLSQIIAESRKHSTALSGPWSAPEEPSSPSIRCFAVSINRGNVMAMYPYDNHRRVISVP